ncbi:MAG TPA: class I SAM-dependent methyltransferase, partial [Nannocystis sp.]
MSTIAAFGSALSRIFDTSEAAADSGRAQALVLDLFDRHVRDARLGLQIGGRSFTVGQGPGEPLATLRLRDASVFTRILAAGNLGLGEAYMDGAVECVGGELHEFLTALLRNRVDQALQSDPRLLARAAWVRLQTLARSKAENVRRHYDAGDDLFAAFLDPTMTYSCGY